MAATGFINGVSVKGQSNFQFTLTLDADPIFPLRMV